MARRLAELKRNPLSLTDLSARTFLCAAGLVSGALWAMILAIL